MLNNFRPRWMTPGLEALQVMKRRFVADDLAPGRIAGTAEM